MRIYELSKQYNCSVDTIIDFLKTCDSSRVFPDDAIKRQNFKVSDEEITLIKEHFADDRETRVNAALLSNARKELKGVYEKDERELIIGQYPEDVVNKLTKPKTGKSKKKAKIEYRQTGIAKHNPSINDRQFSGTPTAIIRGKEKRPANQITSTKEISCTENTPQIITVRWDDVRFQNGKIKIQYLGRDYIFPDERSKEIYSNVILSFSSKLPDLQLMVRGKNITLANKVQYDNVIMCLQEYTAVVSTNPFSAGCVLSKYFAGIFPEKEYMDKGPCFRYLLKLQSDRYRFCCIHENGQNDDGFIFTAEVQDKWFVILESDNSSQLKSTYIFKCDSSTIETTQQKVYNYFCSKAKQKRLSLRRRSQQTFNSDEYTYINHTTYDEWKKQLDSILFK